MRASAKVVAALKQQRERAVAAAQERAELFRIYVTDHPNGNFQAVAKNFRAQFGPAPSHKEAARIVREVRQKAKKEGPYPPKLRFTARQGLNLDHRTLLRAVTALEGIARSLRDLRDQDSELVLVRQPRAKGRGQ